MNTGTDLDSATYCFECNSSVFEQGLERFVSYLTSPKFDNAQEYVQKFSAVFTKADIRKITILIKHRITGDLQMKLLRSSGLRK